MPSLKSALFALVPVLLAIAVYDYVPYAESKCDIVADTECADAFFSEDYWHARHRFRTRAAAAGATTQSYVVTTDARNGREYTIDTAFFPGHSEVANESVLVHTSGTHGVEGFVGSAIQLRALESIAQETPKQRKTSVLFIHAMNPFGFANLRRVNEENVDLNRNLFVDEATRAKVLARDPDFAHYASGAHILNPTSEPSWLQRTIVWFGILQGFVVSSPAKVKHALATGQYHDPIGIYYGGSKEQASHRIFKEILAPLAKMGNKLKKIVLVDVHSGLGPSGVDTIMADDDSTGELAAKIFKRSAQRVEWPANSPTGVAAGYQDTMGDMQVSELVPEAQVKVEITEEFGTVPGVLVLRGLIVENQAWQYSAHGSAAHRYASELLRNVFYVPTPEWKAKTLAHGMTCYEDAVAWLDQRP